MRAAIKHMGGEKPAADVVVVGGGVIGLAMALELRKRGAQVVVLERGKAMQQASSAAAGMLAVDDPGNPPELLPLAQKSIALYPAFLQRLETLSGVAVPFQTDVALQYAEDGSVTRRAEWSIDPRQLAAALVGAVRAAAIPLMEDFTVGGVDELPRQLRIVSVAGAEIVAKQVVSTTGAWTTRGGELNSVVTPRKGQMLRVHIPQGLALDQVHRSEKVYVVPRRFGPQAGTAVIGATVEDAGFDVAVHAGDLAQLRALAAELVPELASEAASPMVEAWAGLRPFTPDALPVIGAVGKGRFIAGGHYRNGVLLAPATAVVMADLLAGETPTLDLSAFAPGRFSR